MTSPRAAPRLAKWEKLAASVDELKLDEVPEVRIVVVGKYTNLSDAYLSVVKALQHAALEAARRLAIDWVESLHLEEPLKGAPEHTEAWRKLRTAHGILVPGGFGDRGIEGKMLAAQYARTNNVPFLGICLGLQIAVIELARNVLGLQGANSTEFNPDTAHDVVIFMPEGSRTHMGGTMRLGWCFWNSFVV
jgi:CTP synthase